MKRSTGIRGMLHDKPSAAFWTISRQPRLALFPSTYMSSFISRTEFSMHVREFPSRVKPCAQSTSSYCTNTPDVRFFLLFMLLNAFVSFDVFQYRRPMLLLSRGFPTETSFGGLQSSGLLRIRIGLRPNGGSAITLILQLVRTNSEASEVQV